MADGVKRRLKTKRLHGFNFGLHLRAVWWPEIDGKFT